MWRWGRRLLPALEPSRVDPLLPAVGLDGLEERALLMLPEDVWRRVDLEDVQYDQEGRVKYDSPLLEQWAQELREMHSGQADSD